MQIRFYAIGRELAGVDACASEARDVPALRADLTQRFGERMGALFDASTLLHNGVRLRPDSDVTWAADDTVELLPPFAGG